MTQLFHCNFRTDSSRANACVLAFSFLAGIFSGVSFGVSSGIELFSLMRGIPVGSVSIVQLYLTLLLPFLFSCVSWVLDSVLLIPICFCRAFLFAWIHTGFTVCFGMECFLLRWLVLFSDILSLPVFYFVCYRRILGRGNGAVCLILPVCLLFLIGTIDYYMILPFYRALYF